MINRVLKIVIGFLTTEFVQQGVSSYNQNHQTYAILLVLAFRRLVFDQSLPVHPVSESRGGYPERDVVGVVSGLYFAFLILDVRESYCVCVP